MAVAAWFDEVVNNVTQLFRSEDGPAPAPAAVAPAAAPAAAPAEGAAAPAPPLLLPPPKPSKRQGGPQQEAQQAPLRLRGPAAPLMLQSQDGTARASRASRAAAAPAAAPAAGSATAAAGAGPARFTPTYEWQALPDGCTVPAGLDIDLPLDGQPRRARIPPRWQLRIWLSDEHGFLRLDVRRSTTIGEVRDAASERARADGASRSVRLALAGRELEDHLTVEQAGLFGRTGELRAELVAEAAAAVLEAVEAAPVREAEAGADEDEDRAGVPKKRTRRRLKKHA